GGLDPVRQLVGGRLHEPDRVVLHGPILPRDVGTSPHTGGSTWRSVWAAANRSPTSSTRARMVRIDQRSGRRATSASSSHVIGADTGAPGAGRTEYGATSVLMLAFWV